MLYFKWRWKNGTNCVKILIFSIVSCILARKLEENKRSNRLLAKSLYMEMQGTKMYSKQRLLIDIFAECSLRCSLDIGIATIIDS